jgi:hypothetical protein
VSESVSEEAEVIKLKEKEERRRLRHNEESRIYYWKHRERLLQQKKAKYHSDENVRQRKLRYQNRYDDNHRQQISDYHKAYNHKHKHNLNKPKPKQR